MDLEDAVSIHGDEEFDIEKDQEEKEDEKKSKLAGIDKHCFVQNCGNLWKLRIH